MKSQCPAQDVAIPLLEMFGDRYIFCDNEQAQLDATYSRDAITDSFAAIIDSIRNGCTVMCAGKCAVWACRRMSCKKRGSRRN